MVSKFLKANLCGFLSLCLSTILLVVLIVPSSAYGALFGDDHSVEEIVKAIQTPLSDKELSKARKMDDQLLSTGDFGGIKGYLVTDPRVIDLPSKIVTNLLKAMGEDTAKWMIRIVDTNPPTVNAFVTGGMYVYIFKALLDQGASEAELAFILAHELGHSYLHHITRQENSDTQALANIVDLVALLAGGQESLAKSHQVTQAFRATFSQTSEMEADAFATVLANKAGYDGVRGADFFVRQTRQIDEYFEKKSQALQAERVQVEQAIVSCQQFQQAYEIYGTYEANINMQAVCTDAENRRLAFNTRLEEFQQEQQSAETSIYATHPTDQNRVAFIVSVRDYLVGNRDLQSLESKYPQAFKTITALQEVDSPLLKPAEVTAESPATEQDAPAVVTETNPTDITQKLRKLKSLYDEGLITEEEYVKKKQELLDQL